MSVRGKVILAALLAGACLFTGIEAVASAWDRPGSCGTIAYRSQIFGIGWGPHGLVIGWSREEGIRARPSCASGC